MKVTEQAERPCGNAGACFYCGRAIGDLHDTECSLIRRKVKVRMTATYEIEVPATFSLSDVDFLREEGSWCKKNALRELEKLFEENCCSDSVTFKALSFESERFLSE